MKNINNTRTKIVLWNLNRNNLKFDIELEESLIKEEINEFYEAYTKYIEKPSIDLLTDMIDAYCDLYFVYQGTLAKAGLSIGDTSITRVNNLLDYGKKYLEQEFSHISYILKDKAFNTVFKALQYVVEANEQKGNEKDKKGKVKKPKDFKDPKVKIKELLKEVLNGEDYRAIK